MEKTSNSVESLQPPPEAYFVKLTPTDIKQGEGTSGVRRIFGGDVKLDAFETKMLADFRAYATKEKKELDPYWEDPPLLRFLQGNAFKFDRSISAIGDHTEWRKKALPPPLTKDVEQFLKDGIFYIEGRDNLFRPIIIFRLYKMDVNKFDADLLIKAITYLFDTVINQMMIPGKVENWIFIIDLFNMGVTNMPYMAMKQIMSFLSNTFRSRLFALYVVNTPRMIFIPWNLIKPLLDETTTRKVNFCSSQIPEPLLTIVSKSQMEVKYGGTMPDRVEPYWPPVFAPWDLKNMKYDEEAMKAAHQKAAEQKAAEQKAAEQKAAEKKPEEVKLEKGGSLVHEDSSNLKDKDLDESKTLADPQHKDTHKSEEVFHGENPKKEEEEKVKKEEPKTEEHKKEEPKKEGEKEEQKVDSEAKAEVKTEVSNEISKPPSENSPLPSA